MKTIAPLIFVLLAITTFGQNAKTKQSAKSLFSQGAIALEHKEYQKAVQHFQLAVSLKENNADYHYGLGLAHFKLGNVDQSLTSMRKALSLNLTESSYYYYIGAAHQIKNDWKRALVAYRNALAYSKFSTIKIDEEYVQCQIGVALMGLGDTEQAITTFNNVLAQNNTHSETLIQRGIAHSNIGNKMQACADFTRAMYYAPDQAKPHVDQYCNGSQQVVVKN